MRSSSWRGPSGRARRRSRRGWRGCGGRSRKTWSWPSRSARPTCPPPRRCPVLAPAGRTPRGRLATGGDSEVPIDRHTLGLGGPRFTLRHVTATVMSRTRWSEGLGLWVAHPGPGNTAQPSAGGPRRRPRIHLSAVTSPSPSRNQQDGQRKAPVSCLSSPAHSWASTSVRGAAHPVASSTSL
eukprot:bmy_18568T0